MIVSIRVIPNSKKPVVIPLGDSRFKVKVDVPATKGKANKRMVEILSDYFHVKKSSITIMKGEHSKEKLVEIT